jgi:imidazolonepropionase-like amidohydrolase
MIAGRHGRLIALSLLAATASAQEPSAPRSFAIVGATVIDVTGGPSQPGVTVVIGEDRILAVAASAADLPGNARVLDGRGKFLIPGLWDMHVHLSWARASALPVLLANGVTSVRDMGGRVAELDEWRIKIAAGLLAGPRILRAGPMLNGKKFNPYQMVTGGPAETRGVVRALKETGVDFLKIHRRLPRDSYFALIEEAKGVGLAVAGHIPMEVTPEEASDAGQASVEHTETLFEGTFSAGLKESELAEAIRRFRAQGAEKLFARFVKNKTFVTPTLVAYRSILTLLDTRTSPEETLGRYVAASMRKAFPKEKHRASDEEIAGWRQRFAELMEVVRQMNRAGVALMAGTDLAGPRIPGFSLHGELALLVAAGLTPLQALRAATLTPAIFSNRATEIGTVAAGKVADLVLLDADPLQDIRNTQRISAVLVGGKLLERGDLDALLRQGEQSASRN